ncbi:MAG: AI-2E family transporter [Candidatus Mcinerneyibacterium aminivorans]|uniref:AI-2E family transporter n=1 Tax=Candidatus Mcinerneyibacterium aminivorans TaxID=2703815 RepID=A0A5D0MD21_9BACT|nr:MAG: AI-2E family transporter [Candidatus Mcinerneyibacterium aminivorans]
MEEKTNEKFIILGLFAVLIGISIIYNNFLTPPLAALFFFYLFYPYRKNILIKRSIVIVGLFLFIWMWIELKYLLMPFAISLFLAYLFDPLIDILSKKIKRGWAVFVFLLFIIGLLVVILIFIIPTLIGQIKNIIELVGKNQQKIMNFFEQKWQILSESKLINADTFSSKIQNFINNLLNQFMSIFSGLTAVFQSIFNILIVPVLTFYLLKDYDNILDWMFDKFSTKKRNKLESGYKRFNMIFGRYIRGVLTDALLVGILTYIGLKIIGIQFGLLIALITMFFTLLPYIGIWISFGISVLIVLTSGGNIVDIIFMAIVYFLIQIIESTIIYPKVVGKMIGIHPVVIMMMLLVLAHFMGIIGFLIGVPLTALLWYFIEQKINKSKEIDEAG